MPADVYGFIASLLSTLTVISTLQKIKEILKYRDISYIPIRLIITYFINRVIWQLYAILNNYHIYLIIPCTFGITLNGYQIYLYWVFSNEDQNRLENSKLLNDVNKLDKQKLGVSSIELSLK